MTVLDRMPADDLAGRIIDGPDRVFRRRRRRGVGRRGPPPCRSARRDAAGAQLSAACHPGRRRPCRRLTGAVPDRRRGARGHHRVLRRSLHGRDGEDPVPGQDRAHSRPAGRLLAGRLDHRRRAARLEGRPSRRRRRLLRQHHGRGEGRDRHLLHLVERRRGGGVDPRGPRGAVLPRPVPRRPRAPDHRPQEPARVGRRVPRARRHQRRRARRPGSQPTRTPNSTCIPNAVVPLRLCISPARARFPRIG